MFMDLFSGLPMIGFC